MVAPGQDSSLEELHAFAAAHGVPRRGFERDHYDVPAAAYDMLVTAGAVPVSSREVVRRLTESGLRRRKAVGMARRGPGTSLRRPPHIRAGDVVAVPATAGVVPADRLRKGVERLEGWGLRVRLGEHVLDRDPGLSYLAGSDHVRATEFTDAWLHPDVSMVMIARGGYGSQRIVDRIDWERLGEAEPKVLVGFSDVTSLHQAVAARLGLATVHSHVVTSLGGATAASAESLRRQLMEPESVTDLLELMCPETVVGGSAVGVLMGGNMSLLAADLGTSSSRSGGGGIVLLEDVGEDTYQVDRILTHMVRAGWFDDVAGLVIGTFTECNDPVELDLVVEARLAPLGVPMIRHVDIGHTDSTGTLPLGVCATLDADAGSLTLAQPALR